MRTKSIFWVFILLAESRTVFSQDPASTMGKVNIASPQAAALGKYIDIPVNYHTGVPSIGLPIHTVSSGPLKMPVSISYHASGLKVEENDSWVGAGWALNAGGVITRTVKDLPDEKKTSSLQQNHGHFSDYGFNTHYVANGMSTTTNRADGEPDLFFYNFGGYSGRFYFNDDRTVVMVPENDVKVEYNYTPGPWNLQGQNISPGSSAGLWRCIESFTLTTPDGTKYFFGIPATNVSAPYCTPIEVTNTMASQGGTSYSQVISSWFLYKVMSADGNHAINLLYERDKYAYYTYTNPPRHPSYTGTYYAYDKVKNLMAGVRLSKIQSATENVDFITGISRDDLGRWASGIDENFVDDINSSSKALGGVSITDATGACIKKYVFSHDYFTDNTSTTHSNLSFVNSDKKRLKLVSMQEQTCSGTNNPPPHTFEYFTEPVPRKLSFAKDHWGYNNGATANTNLYPPIYENTTLVNPTIATPAANRESGWPAMRGGTLSKINYPTGGYTSFDFEPHKFYVIENNANTEKTIGGLRIKRITNYDPVTAKSIETNYSYTDGSNLSTGVLYSKPTYIQVLRNNILKERISMKNVYGNGCLDNLPGTAVNNRSRIVSDNPLRPMENTQGNHIGYSEVKVSQTGNGHSIYRFAVTPSWQIDRTGIAFTQISNPGTCDMTIPNYPAAPLPIDFKRGELVFEGHYNQSGNLLSEKTVSSFYQENPVTTPGILFYNHPSGGYPVMETLYELKTAKKTQSLITEKRYQPGVGLLTTSTETFYESNYHHEPTKIISIDSKGQSLEKKIKYAFDYRVPVFENTANCSISAASYLTHANNLHTSTYSNQYLNCINSCTSHLFLYTCSCFQTALANYVSALATARKNYIDCRKINYTNRYRPASIYEPATSLNNWQINHNIAKAAADAELKPILWMQDNNMNAPIEITEWNNGQLLNAGYTKYNNLRGDEFGVYPEKTLKIDVATLSSTFTPSTVPSNNTATLTRDSRYTDVSAFDFNKGNPINVISRDGVNTSYEWGYSNTLPVAKLVNASNKYKEQLQPAVVSTAYSGYLGPSNPGFSGQVSFVQTATGNISFSIPTPPNGAQVTAQVILSGPVNQNSSLCATGIGGASCSTGSNISFANMPAGTYTLSYTVNTTFGSYSFNYSISHSYNGNQVAMAGSKEFFFESFEENIAATNGTAHTGDKYYNSSYTTAFAPPPGRNYAIHWWTISNGKWVMNTQAYTQGMVLTVPVDDVRIFPTDAYITTYTYNKAGNITSETDPNGKSIYYEYDALSRLHIVRDKDNNIIKKICYNYAGQPENCNSPCPPNSPPNWQNTTTPPTCQQGSCGNTGYQLQEQKDMNACSPTYNQLQTVLVYNPTACPVVSMVTINYQNSGYAGYTATYTHKTTGQQYSFSVPVGTGTLGCIPAGSYTLTISKPNGPYPILLFGSGCHSFEGVSATFGRLSVPGLTNQCITVSLNPANY